MPCNGASSAKDVIVTAYDEVIEIFLFNRFRVKILNKKNPGSTHGDVKHGSHNTRYDMVKRTRGEVPNWIGQNNTATFFPDQEKHRFARERFLYAHEDKMKELAQAIADGNAPKNKTTYDSKHNCFIYQGKIDCFVPVAEGVHRDGIHRRKPHVSDEYTLKSNITTVKFFYYYDAQEQVWYETTGYGDMDKEIAHSRKKKGSRKM